MISQISLFFRVTRVGMAKYASLVTAVLLLGSCNEELPVRRDPANVFDVSFGGLYILSSVENTLQIFMSVVNSYDETFQDAALMQGRLLITLRRDPQYHRSYSLSSANLVTSKGYNPATGQLTINPGDTVKFAVKWDFIDDRNVDFRQDVFKYSLDPSCSTSGRMIADREDFLVSGDMQLFAASGLSIGKMAIVSLCHVNKWVNPKDCPPIITNPPCGGM